MKAPVLGKMIKLDLGSPRLTAKRVDMSAAPLAGERLSQNAKALAEKLARANR